MYISRFGPIFIHNNSHIAMKQLRGYFSTINLDNNIEFHRVFLH